METKKKILIVDDDIDVISIVTTILTKKGYEIISANNKTEGIEKILKEKPDMAILDVIMTTQYEGFELAKLIKDSPDLKDMPILMQTSIDVLFTTKPSVQSMAREYRKNPEYKDLDVLLVKNINTGAAGVDYKSEDGESVWFPVNGFIRKPVDANKIVPEIKKLLS